MDSIQALHKFWSGFGIKAYDEGTVPDGAEFPYITYDVVQDAFDYPVAMTASIWYYGKSWVEIEQKKKEVLKEIKSGGKVIHYDDGAFWIKGASPLAQRMTDTNDMVRRYVINVYVEFMEV